MGSGLTRAAVAALILLASAGAASGIGIGLGIDFSTLELSGAFVKVEPASEEAFDAVYRALVDLGVPQGDLDDARDRFDEGLSSLEGTIARLPSLVPIPYLSLSLEIPLHLLIIDDLRLSAGFVSDSIVYSLADRFGIDLPPLDFAGRFEIGGDTVSATGSATFSSFLLSAEVENRLDLLLFAIDLAGGVHLITGSLDPKIEVEAPPGLQEGLDAAIAALHPDGLSWSSLGAHIGGSFELGPPFFRVSAGARFAVELIRTSGYWDLRSGGFIGTLSLVIRF